MNAPAFAQIEAVDIRPPGEVRALVAAIGEDATFRLLELRGGTAVYVAGHRTEGSVLARELGLDPGQCARLAAAFGDGKIRVPLCRPWRAKVYRQRDRLSYTEIALKLGVTDRAVHTYLRDGGMTVPGPQMALAI